MELKDIAGKKRLGGRKGEERPLPGRGGGKNGALQGP